MRIENPTLEQIRSIIINALTTLTEKEVQSVIYRDFDLEFYFKEESQAQRVSQLSDGFRSMVGLVSDIAYRIAILNPNIKDSCKITPGIVLIDEIDLHLHPKWQRKIVPLLKDLFPNFQFIATSHSPFIIQSMQPHEVINLNTVEQIKED